jgi:hypothetical protein
MDLNTGIATTARKILNLKNEEKLRATKSLGKSKVILIRLVSMAKRVKVSSLRKLKAWFN